MPKVMGWPRARSKERLGLRFAWGPGQQSLEHSPAPSPCGLFLLGRLELAKKTVLPTSAARDVSKGVSVPSGGAVGGLCDKWGCL